MYKEEQPFIVGNVWKLCSYDYVHSELTFLSFWNMQIQDQVLCIGGENMWFLPNDISVSFK